MNREKLERAVRAIKDRSGFYRRIEGDDAAFLETLLSFDEDREALVGPGLSHFSMLPLSSSGYITSRDCETLAVHQTNGKIQFWDTYHAVWAASRDE